MRASGLFVAASLLLACCNGQERQSDRHYGNVKMRRAKASNGRFGYEFEIKDYGNIIDDDMLCIEKSIAYRMPDVAQEYIDDSSNNWGEVKKVQYKPDQSTEISVFVVNGKTKEYIYKSDAESSAAAAKGNVASKTPDATTPQMLAAQGTRGKPEKSDPAATTAAAATAHAAAAATAAKAAPAVDGSSGSRRHLPESMETRPTNAVYEYIGQHRDLAKVTKKKRRKKKNWRYKLKIDVTCGNLCDPDSDKKTRRPRNDGRELETFESHMNERLSEKIRKDCSIARKLVGSSFWTM